MTRIRYNRYDIVARARGQLPLVYESFGSYQGEWLLFAKDEKNYYIYKDYYGSCSGCDNLEASTGWDDNSDFTDSDFVFGSKEVEEFISSYPPFAVCPIKTAESMARENRLAQIFPVNIRTSFDEITKDDWDDFFKQVSLIVKSHGGFITADELFEIRNAETKREAIERFGYKRFIKELRPKLLDEEGNNRLYRIPRGDEDYVFLLLKDSSTPRKYVLRVPTSTKSVREGIAWTFDLEVNEYKPIKET